MRRFWSRKGKAVEKWRSKAWSIDLHKTKLTIITEDPPACSSMGT